MQLHFEQPHVIVFYVFIMFYIFILLCHLFVSNINVYYVDELDRKWHNFCEVPTISLLFLRTVYCKRRHY